MWCNERRSALDKMVCCQTPGCICEHCRRESMAREIEVEPMRKAFLTVRDYFQQARAGDVFVDGALIEFLRVLFANPELLIWDTNYFKDATGLLALKGYVYANHDLEAGFTRVRDMVARSYFNIAVRDAVECGLVTGPYIVACGLPLWADHR